MRRFVSSVIVLIALACGMMSPAYAAGYIDEVAGHLQSPHVWQDPSVNLISTSEVASLEDAVVQSGKPIYVAIVDQSKMSGNDSSSYPKALFGALHRDGAYVVIGLKTFRAAGFNTSYEVAKRTPEIATAAFNNAKNGRGATKPDYQAINELVTGLTGLDFTKPATGPVQEQPAAPAPSSGSSDGSWLWWVVGLFVLGAVIWIVWGLFASGSEYESSYEPVRPSPAPMTTQDLTQNDYPVFNPGNVKDNPSDEEEAAVAPVVAVPVKKRRRKQSTASSAPSRQRTYRTSAPSHPHRWDGGQYQGRYYPAGYYSTDFGTGFLLGQMSESSRHHSQPDTWTSQSSNRDEPRHEERAPVSSSSHDSGYGGGGDWAGSSNQSSEPVYRAPSPKSPDTPPSSSSSGYSSSDSGGGFDFGSSSGGGFSSGGGSNGGDF